MNRWWPSKIYAPTCTCSVWRTARCTVWRASWTCAIATARTMLTPLALVIEHSGWTHPNGIINICIDHLCQMLKSSRSLHKYRPMPSKRNCACSKAFSSAGKRAMPLSHAWMEYCRKSICSNLQAIQFTRVHNWIPTSASQCTDSTLLRVSDYCIPGFGGHCFQHCFPCRHNTVRGQWSLEATNRIENHSQRGKFCHLQGAQQHGQV